LSRTSGPARRELVRVDRARHDLLADTGLAAYQDRDRMIRDLAHELVHANHLRIAHDQLAHRRVVGRRAHHGLLGLPRDLERVARPADQPTDRGAVIGKRDHAHRDLELGGLAGSRRRRGDQQARGLARRLEVELGHHDREHARCVLGDHLHRAQAGGDSIGGLVAQLDRPGQREQHEAEPALVVQAAVDLGGEPLLEVAGRLHARAGDDAARDAHHHGRDPDEHLVPAGQPLRAGDQRAVDPRAVAAAGIAHLDLHAAPREHRVRARHPLRVDADVARARAAERDLGPIGEVEHLRRRLTFTDVHHERDATGLDLGPRDRGDRVDLGELGVGHAGAAYHRQRRARGPTMRSSGA
jgi:hypothetical protein